MSRESTAVEILRAIVEHPYGCAFCDSGKLRTEGNPAKDHDEDCGFARAVAFLAGGAAGPQAPPPHPLHETLLEALQGLVDSWHSIGHARTSTIEQAEQLQGLLNMYKSARGDAARVPPATPQGWQPIETMPHGQSVLVTDGRDVQMTCIQPHSLFPTHWMPLPAVPATPQEK